MAEGVVTRSAPPAPSIEAAPAPGRRRFSQRSYRWVKKLHMYTGLLTFTHFVIYGVAGLVVTFLPAPEARVPSASEVREIPFDAPTGASDKAVADSVFRLLRPPLSRPAPEWALRHDDAGRLLVNFHSPNGVRRVTVEEGALRVVAERTGFGTFLNLLHATTGAYTADDWRLNAWAAYNRFAMWALIGMALSGLYLWLATRPRLRFALAAAVAGNAVFVLLYVLTR